MSKFIIDITEPQFFKLLQSLSLRDAEKAGVILAQRISELKENSAVLLPPETILTNLPLSARTLGVLQDHGLISVADVAAFSLRKLSRRKGVGPRTLREIQEVLGL